MTDTPTTPPVPAAEDDAVEKAAQSLADSASIGWGAFAPHEKQAWRTHARAALDAAGVPALEREVERLRTGWSEATTAHAEEVADLRAGIVAVAEVMEANPAAATLADHARAVRALAGDTAEAGAEGRAHAPVPGSEDRHKGPWCWCGWLWVGGRCTSQPRRPTPDAREDQDGLQGRYYVKRIVDPTGKHDDCRYFVLDPQHDPHAVTALRRYADAAREGYPALAADLDAWVGVRAEPGQVSAERAALHVSAARLVMASEGSPEWRDGFAVGVAALAQAQDDAYRAATDTTDGGAS